MKLKMCRANSLDALVAEKMERDVYHVRRYLRDADWVLDIGANIGAFCLFVKEAYPGVNVVCVEPMPSNLEVLRENIGDCAIIEPAAISGHSGTVRIYDFGLANSGCHSMYDLGVPGAKPVEVQGITLMSLFEKYNICRLRFLKLDCQGAEYDVIQSAGADLLRRIDVIAMEVHRTIAAGDSVLGTIPDQTERAKAMFESLKQTHVLVHGDMFSFDTEQVWENTRGVDA